MVENCGSYNTVRSGTEEIPQDAVPVRSEEFMEYIRQRGEQREQREHSQNNSDQDDVHPEH